MCEQCLAKAIVIKKNILPGFSLMQATTGSDAWPAGFYGLVQVNDPMVVFEGPLLQDPCKGYTEDELDPMPEYPDGYEEYLEGAQALDKGLRLHPEDGYRLVLACEAEGFSAREHGSLGFWLLDFLAVQAGVSLETQS